jgi:hypothetical protein
VNDAANMSDAQFLQALESCVLPQSEFGHAAHVRAAYLYLRADEFAAALARICRSIRSYAAHLGQPERYHETITVAYAALIQQHLFERGDGGGWAGFARANPELFQADLLRRFYSPAQLESAAARAVFLLPRCA